MAKKKKEYPPAGRTIDSAMRYKKDFFWGPFFKMFEAIFELITPVMMSLIVSKGLIYNEAGVVTMRFQIRSSIEPSKPLRTLLPASATLLLPKWTTGRISARMPQPFATMCSRTLTTTFANLRRMLKKTVHRCILPLPTMTRSIAFWISLKQKVLKAA